MTPAPICVSPDDPLPSAHAMMREHEFRHLPVVRGDVLVGVLSERDMGLMHALAGDPQQILVEDAMSRDPYVVAPDVPLSKVARAMLERKIGSAVVVDGRRIAGLFTITDALQALVEALDGTYARRTYEAVTTEPPEARRGRDVR